MKEISILCVEDGSVDVESLKQEGLSDVKILIYRQGANPPFVLKSNIDDGEFKSEQNKVAVEKLEELKLKLRKLEFQQISTFEAINSMIKELKGRNNGNK